MPAKKKVPNLRWKRKDKEHSWLKSIFNEPTFVLEQWNESSNKYVEVPFVD